VIIEGRTSMSRSERVSRRISRLSKIAKIVRADNFTAMLLVPAGMGEAVEQIWAPRTPTHLCMFAKA